MTDPAVEAAQRAWEKNKIHSFTVQRVNAEGRAIKRSVPNANFSGPVRQRNSSTPTTNWTETDSA